MEQREVYPNAPLRLVSLEVKFPVTSRVLTRALWDALEEILGEELPNADVSTEEPDSSIPGRLPEPVLRRISKDHKRAVTLYCSALTIELADYKSYADLTMLTEMTLSALARLPNFLRATRMGLRYINEIKSELVGIPEDKWQHGESWAPYINQDLLNEVDKVPDSLCAYGRRETILFHSKKGDEQATFDYLIHPEGMMDPDGVLALGGEPGPCFVLDIDAFYYTPPESAYPDSQRLLQILGRLHENVESIFQWSVTDRMREVFNGAVQNKPDESLLSASNG
jgi:uncharacterized protein (TIGR04255 family)